MILNWPGDIPIEAWKCLGVIGWVWLTRLLNKILRTKIMPNEWRKRVADLQYLYTRTKEKYNVAPSGFNL